MGPDEAGGLAASETLPLIPRTAFFGNPAKAAGQISPDGRWLSWLAARNGSCSMYGLRRRSRRRTRRER